MIDAIARKHTIPLFNKLAVNRWEFLGYWRVTASAYIFDEIRERMTWKFTLERDC